MFVGEQFDAVVERADRRKKVMAEPRTEQTGEFVRFHARLSPMAVGFDPIGLWESAMQGQPPPPLEIRGQIPISNT